MGIRKAVSAQELGKTKPVVHDDSTRSFKDKRRKRGLVVCDGSRDTPGRVEGHKRSCALMPTLEAKETEYAEVSLQL